MYWYLTKPEDLPLYYLDQLSEIDAKGLIKPSQETLEITKKVYEWTLASGRNLFRLIDKASDFFLAYAIIKFIFGGNRSGKSATCTLDVLMQIEGWHPLQRENLEKLAVSAIDEKIRKLAGRYLDERKWIASPPVAARCEVVDFPSGCEKIAGPEYMKWATKSMIKYCGFDNEKKRKIEWTNKSFLEFMSHDQDLDSHGGVARNVIHEDEEPPSDIHQENMMRILSCNGRMIGGMTAIKGLTWVKDAIWDKFKKNDKNIYCIQLKTSDNILNSPEIIEQIRGMCLDKDEEAIRLDGEFKARGGLIYFMAKERFPWVIEPFDIPEEDGYLMLCIDTHTATPHGFLWVWADYSGKYHPIKDDKPNLYEIAELFENGTVSQMVDMIDLIELRLNRKHDYFLLEPAAWQTDQTKPEDKTIAEQFEDYKLYPQKASKDLIGGIHLVRDMLLAQDETKDFPRLMTFSTCKRVIWERSRYRTPDLRGRSADERAKPDTPLDKDDHLMQCERRICQYIDEAEIKDVFTIKSDRKQPIMINHKGEKIDVKFDYDDENDENEEKYAII